MKKTIAAGGASVLGLAAVSLGAAPAQADHEAVVELCDDSTDHAVSSSGHVGSNWYMDCIPQYGLGLVDFHIVPDSEMPDTPFPDGFLPLTDAGVSSVAANTGAAASAYFGVTPPPAGFTDLRPLSSTDTRQRYEGEMMFAITSVDSIAPEDLPGACQGGDFTNSYVVNYAPANVTFTQVIDGVEWRYDLVATPGPLFFGLNILETGAFAEDAPQCVSANGISTYAANTGNPWWYEVIDHATLADDGTTLFPYFGSAKSLPDIDAIITPAAPEEPTLPATGADPAGTIGLAAMFLALGVAGGYLRRRQSRA